jgi:hydrogenase maturation factor
LDNTHCGLNSAEYCITCSDEVQLAHVLQINQEELYALVMIEDTDTIEEIDISLVETISPGDQLLVHGGVAIAHAG